MAGMWYCSARWLNGVVGGSISLTKCCGCRMELLMEREWRRASVRDESDTVEIKNKKKELDEAPIVCSFVAWFL